MLIIIRIICTLHVYVKCTMYNVHILNKKRNVKQKIMFLFIFSNHSQNSL